MATIYAVTAVSASGDVCSLGAVPSLADAEHTAMVASRHPEWVRVDVNRDATGIVVATYVDGQCQPDTFAPAHVREQDARNFPHDEPCPRCGRRQWGLGPGTVDRDNPSDAEQMTCGACGTVFTDDDV